ncbi:MAG: hypothetical protein KDI19_09330 [Pseudomonadales bacterium]|nr:hypothetical protein [Pseudomonadales bacterium]
MIHEVNLYKAEFRPKRLIASFHQIVGAWLVVVLVCAGVSVWMHAGRIEQQEKLAKSLHLESQLNLQIASLSKELEQRSSDTTLERKNEQLKARLKQGADLLTFLEGRKVSLDGTASLAGMLKGFARQSGQGLWLTEIHAGGEDELSLSGYVDHAERIPAYLKRLGRDPAFEGRHFTALQVETVNKDGVNQLSFRLRSKPDTEATVATRY